MAAKRRFDISDEVRGIVRLLDVGGPGAVTIEITATGQRITMAELDTRTVNQISKQDQKVKYRELAKWDKRLELR